MIEKVKLHIDSVGYDSKKSVKEDIEIIKNRVQCKNAIEVTMDDLIQAIKQGKTISPAVMNGPKQKDFIEQQLFMVDIDNENKNAPILYVQDALNICKEYNLSVAFYYYSFSHTEEIPKYRLVFVLDRILTNINIQHQVVLNLCSLFEQADKSCINADRLFFGTNKEVIKCDTLTPLAFENIFSIVSPAETNRKTKEHNDTELDRLKANFNFFEYLKNRNGDLKSDNSKYAMFKKCEICGHNDDLVYYKDTNTFKCFGANGGQYGSIIDYLMAVEKIDVSQAIDKLKYELCGIEKQIKTIESISAKELLSKPLKKPYIVVNDMLCQGFTILGGPPKIGKSWLCLDLCISVCNGQPFLEFETNQSECLYLALEDSYNRLQDRLKKVLGTNKVPEGFHLAIYCEPLNEGLIEELEDQIKQHPNIKLIIIDTLQKVRGNQGKTESAYSYDYKEIGKLKYFADENELCILAIHHLRKGKDRSDPFNQISGSTGLTGAADTSIVLDKTENSNILLAITGRDVESTEKLIQFDKLAFKWSVIGDASDFDNLISEFEYNQNPIVMTIKKLLEANQNALKITASDLLVEIYNLTGNYPKQDKPNTLSREINNNLRLKLLHFDKIHYEAPNKNGGASGRIMFFSKSQ